MAITVEPWRIPEEGQSICGEEPAESLALESDSLVKPRGAIRYDLHLQFVSGELVADGTVEVPVGLACSRCGKALRQTVREPAFSCVIEVENKHAPVDLTNEVRESIILALPMFPLCQEACRGLCSRCGADLNETACRCKKPAGEGWGAFDAL
jgi:uncharacterized protein